MSPTRRLAVLFGLIALMAVALQGIWGIAVALAGGVIGLVVVDMVALSRAHVGVERTQIPTLARGVDFGLHVRVSVSGGGSVRLRQPVPPELSLVPAEAPGDLSGVLVGRHRGVHVLPRAVVRMRGPIGLVSSDRHSGERSDIVVMPDLPRRDGWPSHERGAGWQKQGRTAPGSESARSSNRSAITHQMTMCDRSTGLRPHGWVVR